MLFSYDFFNKKTPDSKPFAVHKIWGEINIFNHVFVSDAKIALKCCRISEKWVKINVKCKLCPHMPLF